MTRVIAPTSHSAWLRRNGFVRMARITEGPNGFQVERIDGVEAIRGGNYVIARRGRAMLIGETGADLVARMRQTLRWAWKSKTDRAAVHRHVYERCELWGRPQGVLRVMGCALSDRLLVEVAVMERLRPPLNVRHAAGGYAGINGLRTKLQKRAAR